MTLICATLGTSLVVQWLRLRAVEAWVQFLVGEVKAHIPHAMWYGQERKNTCSTLCKFRLTGVAGSVCSFGTAVFRTYGAGVRKGPPSKQAED